MVFKFLTYTSILASLGLGGCLKLPEWRDPPKDAGISDSVRDAEMDKQDVNELDGEINDYDVTKFSDASLADVVKHTDVESLKDSGRMDVGIDVQFEDARIPSDTSISIDVYDAEHHADVLLDGGRDEIDAELPEADVLAVVDTGIPERCYTNRFDSDRDLEDFVFQSENWERDPAGYLKQTRFITDDEIGRVIGAMPSYIDNISLANLEANVRVMLHTPQQGRTSSSAGLLFRYNPQSVNGFDENLDRGYALQLEDHGGFAVTIEDFYHSRLTTTPVNANYEEWHILGLRVNGGNIEADFDGLNVLRLEDDTYRDGKIGLTTHATGADFDDLDVCER